MIEVLPLLLAMAIPAADSDVRIVVAIGNNVGISGDQPLDYAREDARRFHRLMTEIGGVSDDRAYLVLGEDAKGVRRVLNEARGRIKELAEGQRTSLIVFVSAHADAEQLHVAGTTLPLGELHDLVRTSVADLKLTVIDACRTPAQARQKGGRPAPEVDVTFGEKSRIDGDVLISSASVGEPAQERTFLRGALFSHHLMTGLRGAADVDDDGSVSLVEAYSYAYRRTAADAVRGGAAQHPSFEFDTRGFGAWVLTRPGGLRAGIVLAEGIQGTIWIANRKRELVAEIAKTSDEVVRLALSPGWYRVVRPDGAAAHVADVNLGWGGVRELRDRDFVRTRLTASILKGRDAVVLRPWRVGAGYALGLNPYPGPAIDHRLVVQLGYGIGRWQLRLSTTLTTNRFRTPNLRVRNWSGGIGLGAAYGVGWRWFTVGLAAELRVTLLRQDIERDDAEVIQQLFGVADSSRVSATVGALGSAFWAIPIGDRWWVRIEGGVGLERVPRFDGSSGVEPTVSATGLIAWAF